MLLFFGICIANAIECALMRGYSKIDIVLIVKEKANRKVRLLYADKTKTAAKGG